MLKSISRNDESKLPNFKSHDEAREYFKKIYGNSFQMMDSMLVDGMKLYFYDLILNDVGDIINRQRIEIFENGRIHIIH